MNFTDQRAKCLHYWQICTLNQKMSKNNFKIVFNDILINKNHKKLMCTPSNTVLKICAKTSFLVYGQECFWKRHCVSFEIVLYTIFIQNIEKILRVVSEKKWSLLTTNSKNLIVDSYSRGAQCKYCAPCAKSMKFGQFLLQTIQINFRYGALSGNMKTT